MMTDIIRSCSIIFMLGVWLHYLSYNPPPPQKKKSKTLKLFCNCLYICMTWQMVPRFNLPSSWWTNFTETKDFMEPVQGVRLKPRLPLNYDFHFMGFIFNTKVESHVVRHDWFALWLYIWIYHWMVQFRILTMYYMTLRLNVVLQCRSLQWLMAIFQILFFHKEFIMTIDCL